MRQAVGRSACVLREQCTVDRPNRCSHDEVWGESDLGKRLQHADLNCAKACPAAEHEPDTTRQRECRPRGRDGSGISAHIDSPPTSAGWVPASVVRRVARPVRSSHWRSGRWKRCPDGQRHAVSYATSASASSANREATRDLSTIVAGEVSDAALDARGVNEAGLRPCAGRVLHVARSTTRHRWRSALVRPEGAGPLLAAQTRTDATTGRVP